MIEQPRFFDQSALLHRLSSALKKRDQQVVFLLGSALSAPVKTGSPGVPSTDDLIEFIRHEFYGDRFQLEEFEKSIDGAGEKRYQAAFWFLQGRLGQSAANEIIREAVWRARAPESGNPAGGFNVRTANDDELRLLEVDSCWHLNPGTTGIGKLVARYPGRFGRLLLTTNFDPLIEIAIKRAGGQFFRTFLHADGNLSQTEGSGCHVIHLHGYWYGCDTLHTNRQLQQSRPHLKASLSSLLRDKLTVVCGYGGWDDIFTEALMDSVRDDSASPEILWTFFSDQPSVGDSLAKRIAPGVDRGRVSLYAGVDCNSFFPDLYELWGRLESEVQLPPATQTNPVQVRVGLREEVEKVGSTGNLLPGDDEDRPPLIEYCIGRDVELRQLQESNAKVVFITGIGGQGKSTLAAQYFSNCQFGRNHSYFVWRDCKEETERFENQLASIVETLSNRRISGEDLAKQDAPSIIQLLMPLIANLSVLFVFDNVDHYINLDKGLMTACPDLLIHALLGSKSNSRIILTCRPTVEYDHPLALSLHLAGLSVDATRLLFSERGAACSDVEILNAHELTNGHAFWLDLLSLQVTKQATIGLGQLVDRIRSESGQLPEKTLNSIWTTLREREQIVLRSMAETVRPETVDEIAEYIRSHLSYHKVLSALAALKAMNLVVVKRRKAAPDVLELHPLVRQFIRRSFSQIERSSFIDQIIKAYARFMGNHKFQLKETPSLTTLQHWTQAAELDIAAGRIDDAFATLLEAAGAFETSGYSRELVRAVRLLLRSIDWVSEHDKYKYFDALFRGHVKNLTDLGEPVEVDKLLESYELTIPEIDARYILYCDLRCYAKWVRGDFIEAVKWGQRGKALRESVDTKFDVSHNLALAERDAGQPDIALPFFLAGRGLTEVIDPDELDEQRGGAHYGNIGRCLHLMGQVDSALVCYQKSAVLIESDRKEQQILNQGFIRLWIGEVLIARAQYRLASAFLEAARLKWEQVSPPRALQIVHLQERFKDQLHQSTPFPANDVERVCRDWILGRRLDS